jgi:hypothetical protein
LIFSRILREFPWASQPTKDDEDASSHYRAAEIFQESRIQESESGLAHSAFLLPHSGS